MTPLTEAELDALSELAKESPEGQVIAFSKRMAIRLIQAARRAGEYRNALEQSAEALRIAIETHENGNCAAEVCWYPHDLQSLALTAARAALGGE